MGYNVSVFEVELLRFTLLPFNVKRNECYYKTSISARWSSDYA